MRPTNGYNNSVSEIKKRITIKFWAIALILLAVMFTPRTSPAPNLRPHDHAATACTSADFENTFSLSATVYKQSATDQTVQHIVLCNHSGDKSQIYKTVDLLIDDFTLNDVACYKLYEIPRLPSNAYYQLSLRSANNSCLLNLNIDIIGNKVTITNSNNIIISQSSKFVDETSTDTNSNSTTGTSSTSGTTKTCADGSKADAFGECAQACTDGKVWSDISYKCINETKKTSSNTDNTESTSPDCSNPIEAIVNASCGNAINDNTSTDGSKDRDGDGIIDSEDNCPDAFDIANDCSVIPTSPQSNTNAGENISSVTDGGGSCTLIINQSNTEGKSMLLALAGLLSIYFLRKMMRAENTENIEGGTNEEVN